MDKFNIVLNPKQSLFFSQIFTENMEIRDDAPEELAYFGAFRCGKSLVTMLITFYLCSLYENVNWLFCRSTYPELSDSVIPQFMQLFPPDTSGYAYKQSARNADFSNGSRINFRAFDKDTKILSNEYSGATLCQAEEIPHKLFLQVLGRLSGKAVPKRFLLVEGNPADSWAKERYVENKPDHVFFINGSMEDNKANLDPKYMEGLLRDYPQDYIERYIYGGWDRTSDRVYTALKSHHITPKIWIQKHFYVCIGYDHAGINDTSLVWVAKDESGNMFICDEWHKSQAQFHEVCQALTRHGNLNIIADYSMKTPDRDQGSWWLDLQQQGFRLIEANKASKFDNILLVNKLFHQNKLFIFDNLEYVIKQHKGYKYKPARLNETENRREEVVKKDDHSVDAVQYAVQHLKDIEVDSPAKVFAPVMKPYNLRL
jgi:PBSX family phage terminase large subunit